ncbi:MAG: helix-turn-helix domain-containing protein [Cyanobacteria bacterium P01_F01_bin.3]
MNVHQRQLDRPYSTAIIAGPICNMLGLDWFDVAHHSKLRTTLTEENLNFVSADEYIKIWNVIAASAALPNMSRKLGERMASGPAIPVLFAMSSAPNLLVGIGRFSNFKHIFGPIRIETESLQDEFRIRFLPDVDGVNLPATFSSPQVIYVHAKARLLAMAPYQPKQVSLPLPEAERKDLFDLFGQKPTFGQPEICYSMTDATAPFISNNSDLWRATEHDLQTLAENISSSQSTSERVRAVLTESFAITAPTMATVCMRLGISRSNLIRRLRSEGTTFQSVLDETRTHLALRYLRSGDLSIQQISHLIGYADNNAFQRAFKRWTGETPGQMRLKLQAMS